MGLIGTLLAFARGTVDDAQASEATVDPGGGANITAHHYACPGDDSHPLAGDFVATVPGPGSGNELAVGYLDPSNAGQAGPGEKRVYARKSDGSLAAVVWLKSNGDVVVESVEGAVQILVSSDGSVRLGSAAATKGVARLGDAVQVTIPSGTALVNPSTGQTTAPIVITGEITGASGTVKAAD